MRLKIGNSLKGEARQIFPDDTCCAPGFLCDMILSLLFVPCCEFISEDIFCRSKELLFMENNRRLILFVFLILASVIFPSSHANNNETLRQIDGLVNADPGDNNYRAEIPPCSPLGSGCPATTQGGDQ